MDVLTSGVYDTFTVTHAVTVKADPGITATINVLSTTGIGITVSAGGTDNVTISGFTLRGPGTNAIGIEINSGGLVTVENCDSRNFYWGLAFVPTVGPSELKVSGGTFSGSDTGIYTATSVGDAVIDGVNVYGSNIGIEAAALYTTITHSRVTGAGGYAGIRTNFGTTVLESDVVSRYIAGVKLDAGVTYLSSCTITSSYFGVEGTAYSLGNNTLSGNIGANVYGGTLTPYSLY